MTLGTTFDQCMSLKSIFGSLFSIVFSLCVDIAFIFFVFLRVRLLRVGYSIKIAFRAKLEQEQGSRIRHKIRIDVKRCCRDVKQVVTPSECIHKFHNKVGI